MQRVKRGSLAIMAPEMASLGKVPSIFFLTMYFNAIWSPKQYFICLATIEKGNNVEF